MMASTFRSKREERNWLELPSDVTANIFKRISFSDILENVEKVCTAWHKILTDDPTMWRVIDMSLHAFDMDALIPTEKGYFLISSWIHPKTEEWFKCLVDRSQGQLVDVTITYDSFDIELLLYVADRSSQLKRLVLAHGYNIGRRLTKALMNFPLLEELSLYFVEVPKEVIECAGWFCPMLKTLKVNQRLFRIRSRADDEESLRRVNEIAIAIGGNLPELRHLEIIGNMMTNIGLEAILDGCGHLETLDLRQCLNIDLKGDLGKRCLKQIKVVKLCQEPPEYHNELDDGYDCYVDDPEVYDGYISQ